MLIVWPPFNKKHAALARTTLFTLSYRKQITSDSGLFGNSKGVRRFSGDSSDATEVAAMRFAL